MATGKLPDAGQILNSLINSILLLDDSLAVHYANPAAQQLLAQSSRKLFGTPLPDLLGYFSLNVSLMRESLRAGQGFTDNEVTLVVDGRAHILSLTAQALPEGYILVELAPMDNQRRLSQEQLQHAQQVAARDLVRGLAHEIKNPLGGLRGAAQLLEREIDDDGIREYTTVIIREADRLQNLVDNLLGPRRPPNKRMLNVHEPLEHVRALIEADLAAGITLERDYDPSIPEIGADREQLIQTFFNLIGNAITALETAGHILLRTRTQRLFTIGGIKHRLVARIDIIDDGPGIARDLLPRIFLPMVSSRAEGSGMGLPIAQYLIHLHAGQIECESRPGRTVFSVFLPMESLNG